MQVDIDEIGVEKIRGTEFLLGSSVSDDSLIYFAPLDQKGGPKQRWMVVDENHWNSTDGYITVYTTEEMRFLYRSMKGHDGRPCKANKEIGYHFLVRSGKLRMKLRDGCAGCRRFWGGDSEGQCVRCHRCYACCGKESVPFSCASSQAQEVRKKGYARRKQF
jgi:hypothetical protein